MGTFFYRWWRVDRLDGMLVFLLIATSLGLLMGMSIGLTLQPSRPVSRATDTMPLPTPAPTPYVFDQYRLPRVAPQEDYRIFLVGDSMTDALGPHPSRLSDRLNSAYPTAQFVIDNYSEGGQNVTALPKLLTTPKQFPSILEPAALERDFDILVIESFGQNPLSHLPIEEGLLLQEQVLTEMMTRLTRERPGAVIIFLATLGPSPTKFADGLLNLPAELKAGFVRERQAYIENHIAYAQEHGIPLINVYDETRDEQGNVDLTMLRADDHLHPSQKGVDYIQDQIADHIIDQGYLPQVVTSE